MLSYEFMQNAFMVGIMIGILLPIVGVSIMFRRMIFISDSLGHINMSGIAFAIFITSIFSFLDSYYSLIVLIWTILGALLIEYLRLKFKNYREVSIMIVYSLSIALTMLFLNLSSGYNASLFNILFGNINAISRLQVLFIFISIIIMLVYIRFSYRELILYSMKEEYSKLYDINQTKLKYISIIIIALTVSLAIKVVGVLLVSTIISLPLIASSQVSKSLKKTVLVAILISEISIILGIVLAYYLNISTSAMIVLLILISYLICVRLKK